MARKNTASPEAAGHLMVRAVAVADANAEARRAFCSLAGGRFDCLQNLHVVDADRRLLGVVPLTALAGAPPGVPVRRLMRPVRGLRERDRVVPARESQLAAPPVVDAEGRLLGCIPPQAVLALGRRAHGRDVARIAGILHAHAEDGGGHALGAPPLRRAAARLPWLLVGLVGSALTAAMVAGFEERLAAHIAVAFFIPAIVYLADAVGTQTEAAVVRGLSFGPIPLGRLLAGEAAAGALIGAALGALALPLVGFAMGDWALALAVSLAVGVGATAATLCGLLFPWLLARLGLDPAFGSGPVATVIQDALSLLLYFAAVWLIVPR
jgi:magnesium transporter